MTDWLLETLQKPARKCGPSNNSIFNILLFYRLVKVSWGAIKKIKIIKKEIQLGGAPQASKAAAWQAAGSRWEAFHKEEAKKAISHASMASKASEYCETRSESWKQRGNAYYKIKKYEAALECYQGAIAGNLR